MATGHYVQRVEGADGPELHRAADADRDQSYFLFAPTRAQLDFLRFPLGGMPKPQVRALAAELGLKVAAKPDSQDICFVPSGKYQSVVEKLRSGAIERAKSCTSRPRARRAWRRDQFHPSANAAASVLRRANRSSW